MIPITKNEARIISVIDAEGNVHKPTYPKRAKGLVKKGRARFVDGDTILLSGAVCYTDDTSGEIKMSDINKDNAVNTDNSDFKELEESLNNSTINGRCAMDVANEYFAAKTQDYIKAKITVQPDMNYILSRIDKIIDNSGYIKEAITAVSNLVPNEAPDGGTGDAGRANAIQCAVQSRETTNQRLIEMLDKMYDDLKPHRAETNAELLQTILESCQGGPFSDGTAMLLDKVQSLIKTFGIGSIADIADNSKDICETE